jgi:hypothetical protein
MKNLPCPPLLAALVLAACDPGPAVLAQQQAITFEDLPAPPPGQESVTVVATATSGLPITYLSLTPAMCSVDASSGRVNALVAGACTIAAQQPGNDRFAPAPQVTQQIVFIIQDALVFGAPPRLAVFDLATVTATDRFGLEVRYVSATPSICAVDAATGVVEALGMGLCTIAASAGPLQETQSFPVAAAASATAPDAPSSVSASLGEVATSVRVQVGAIASGGRPITAFTVSSSPPGLSGTAARSPIDVVCPTACDGYRITVSATSAGGGGALSTPVDVVTAYQVVATFYESATQPNDSVFVGAFSVDSTTGAVLGLRGRLSESMTGGAKPYPNDSMTWLRLDHQLSSIPATLGGVPGLLVTTFLLDRTDTLSSSPTFGGTDGWTPGSGSALYYRYPGANPGNAYARLFIDPRNPAGALAAAQLDGLAYADCTPGGMMGATCMTGTSVAGYGSVGSMSGVPASQVAVRK